MRVPTQRDRIYMTAARVAGSHLDSKTFQQKVDAFFERTMLAVAEQELMSMATFLLIVRHRVLCS